MVADYSQIYSWQQTGCLRESHKLSKLGSIPGHSNSPTLVGTVDFGSLNKRGNTYKVVLHSCEAATVH